MLDGKVISPHRQMGAVLLRRANGKEQHSIGAEILRLGARQFLKQMVIAHLFGF
jgi:hypothetical protein